MTFSLVQARLVLHHECIPDSAFEYCTTKEPRHIRFQLNSFIFWSTNPASEVIHLIASAQQLVHPVQLKPLIPSVSEAISCFGVFFIQETYQDVSSRSHSLKKSTPEILHVTQEIAQVE